MSPTPWPEAAHALLAHDDAGHLVPTPAYFAHWMARPELALVPESCRAEKRLHQALQADPLRPVPPAELQALRDPDARENYAHVLSLRDALHAAGTLERWLLALWRGGHITVPPLFIDLVVQAVVQDDLQQHHDALDWRAAELLFRPQRITLEQGRVLAADRHTLEEQQATRGLGDIGRLLADAQAPVKGLELRVCNAESAPRYWADAVRPGFRSALLLDLTHQLTQDVGHGVQFTLKARSGLQPLAAALQRWVRRLLGVDVRITPLQKIDDPQWRWHVGLDTEATALLNDLYTGLDVVPDRLQRLVSLFRLEFAHAHEMRRDVAGRPVYLGLMADPAQNLRLKPQNLLLNLPLADAAA